MLEEYLIYSKVEDNVLVFVKSGCLHRSNGQCMPSTHPCPNLSKKPNAKVCKTTTEGNDIQKEGLQQIASVDT